VPGLGWSDAQAREIVRDAFVALLGREPDEDGLRFYVNHLVNGRLDIHSFLDQLIASSEFSGKSTALGYSVERDEALTPYLTDPAVRDLSSRLANVDLEDLDLFGALVDRALGEADMVTGQREYVAEHGARFLELFHAARVLTSGVDRPRVLEFGASVFSAFYKSLLPGCRLVMADRPVVEGYPGFDEALCEKLAQPDAFVPVDLLSDLQAPGITLDRHGPFDLVVFTEVLANLTRHPVEILQFLLKRLTFRGSLYLTTPNAFSHGKLDLIGRRRNPQQVFPRGDGNWDADYHSREYSMSELVEFVKEARGRVRALHFSSCWDAPDRARHLAQHPDQRSTLVIVVSRQ
jgi:uncharacterized protein DUF4214